MTYVKHASALAWATAMLAAAGCGGGGGSSSDGGTGAIPEPPAAPAPPPPPTGTNFTLFTRDLLVAAKTNESDAAVELESIEWVFTDDENETTYDDILTASGP